MPKVLYLAPGAVIGLDNRFTPNDADTPYGGNGQTVDGLPCLKTMVTNLYHVHAFVGIIDNGVQLALPDAIGMHDPGTEVNGFTNAASCFYYIHTHDASGLVHFESPSSAPLSTSVYTLGNVLDVWGMRIAAGSFGPFSGPVHVFVATAPLRSTYSGPYAQFAGDPRTIKMYSHEAIWIEIGTSYYTAAQLPAIRFYTEY